MSKDEIKWRLAIPGKMVHPNEVHVWCAFLDLPAFQRDKMLEYLSANERARASRFHFQRDQNRFIVAHGVLREILGAYLKEDPSDLQFVYSAKGKPSLANDLGSDMLQFNLSHCGPLALYAITQRHSLGIDIERVRDDVAIWEIAQRFFSATEINALEMISEKIRHELFFKYWTRKEAFLKALGEGLFLPPEQVDVSLLNGNDLSLVTFPGNKRESERWYAKDLSPSHDYVAAIAVDGYNWNISCWQYSA